LWTEEEESEKLEEFLKRQHKWLQKYKISKCLLSLDLDSKCNLRNHAAKINVSANYHDCALAS